MTRDVSLIHSVVEARRALMLAKAAMPDLMNYGIVMGGRRDENFDLEQITTSIAFFDLSLCIPTKIPNISSYALKHVAERWGRAHGRSPYVTNGALIVAAHYVGLSIKRLSASPNVAIGVRRRWLREAWAVPPGRDTPLNLFH
jgi:hypothetical protein